MDVKNKIQIIISIIVRIIILIVSCIMIMWYMDSGFIAFGSIVGITVFGTTGLAALCWDLIRLFCKKIMQKKWGKILVHALMGLTGIFVLYVAVAIGLMLYGANNTPDENATVVVLGCQVRGTVPSHALRNRLDTAFSYLDSHPSAKAVLSGGKGSGEDISEAQCMYNYLTEKGISPDRLFMEDRSTTTNENIRFSKEIIENNGLSQDLAVVTDWYHEFRASMICRRNNISCGAVPAPTPRYLTAHLVTREIFAIPHEFFMRS